MKKGISFWEEHLEKIVLAVCAVVLVGAAGTVMMERPNRTTVGTQEVDPAEVNGVILAKAGDLGRRLQETSSADTAGLEAVKTASADGFLDRLNAGVAPAPTLPRIAPAFASILLPEEVGSVDVLYYEPVIASPLMRSRVVQTQDTLEETATERYPELGALFGGDELDLVWTTPVAEINLAELRAELAASDALAKPARVQIPGNWYRDRPYLLDVVFERQERRADGTWSAAVPLPVIPGARSIRARIAQGADIDAGFRDEVFMNLDDPIVQQEILQPDFYATVNARFTPPMFSDRSIDEVDPEDDSIDEEEADRLRRVRELTRRLRDRTITLNRTAELLKELGGELDENSEGAGGSGRGDRGRGRGSGSGSGSGRGGPPGGDPNGGGGPGGPGGGFGGKRGNPGANSEAQRRQRIGLTKKVRKLEAEIERIQADLAELDPSSVDTAVDSAQTSARLLDTLADERVLAWTHDIAVKPGATYRYRASVKAFNPLFARGRQLLESQRERSEDFALASLASRWSEPVTIDPPVQFFFVRASEDGGTLGLGEARIEMYRYHDGRQRSARFTVQPGERIGSSSLVDGGRVDFETDWYLVDVIADPASTGRNGLDSDDDSIVVCRRLDGTEIKVRVPSSQLRDPNRTRLEMDARETQARR
jgi:hypothetical protein